MNTCFRSPRPSALTDSSSIGRISPRNSDSAPRIQRRIGDATVAILGCGGLGSWAAAGLACAGVGSLVLIDDDRVERSNLNRQLLFGEPDIGRPKVDSAAEALRRHRSDLDVRAVSERIDGPEGLRDVLGGRRPDRNRGLAAVSAHAMGQPGLHGSGGPVHHRGAVPATSAHRADRRPRTVGMLGVPRASDTHPTPALRGVAARPPRPSTSATLGPASGLALRIAMEDFLLSRSVRPQPSMVPWSSTSEPSAAHGSALQGTRDVPSAPQCPTRLSARTKRGAG